jgi:hypothetical protein
MLPYTLNQNLSKRAQLAVAAWIFFYRLVPETKGKNREQIEAHWRAGKHPSEMR